MFYFIKTLEKPEEFKEKWVEINDSHKSYQIGDANSFPHLAGQPT